MRRSTQNKKLEDAGGAIDGKVEILKMDEKDLEVCL